MKGDEGRVRGPAVAPLRVHDLRHTAAALLIAQGAHPKVVQAHLGHASITTTLDRYGHLFPDDMDRLAEALQNARSKAQAGQMRDRTGSNVSKLPVGESANAF